MDDDLFAHARRSDPQTSHDAAASMGEALPNLEGLVLAQVRQAGDHGVTLDELCDALSIDKVTISPRLRPLCDKALVKASGKRPGKSRRAQTIWVRAQ